MTDFKSLFQLDPQIIFLNHGSFGACPIPVFEEYQEWQRRLERQPVLFLGREFARYDREARQALGAFLGADPDDLVFIPNATHGVNIVARSLDLQPGDEILSTNHEYGACDFTWEFIASKLGARYVRRQIPLPLPCDDEIVETLWKGVRPRTRVIFLSHYTSTTALRLPVEAVCLKARQSGLISVIDGAHAPGQIHLNLSQIGADFYTGNCHKWMLAPKGAAFLYSRREAQPLIEPLIVSWGYRPTEGTTTGSAYVDRLSWTGTRDPAAALTVPAAIRFLDKYNWEAVRKECHALACHLRSRLIDLNGGSALCPEDKFIQMFSAGLPPETDIHSLKTSLYERDHIEVPLIEWNGRKLIRVSIQAYNTTRDQDLLVAALTSGLQQSRFSES